jgi:hypothetical protein
VNQKEIRDDENFQFVPQAQKKKFVKKGGKKKLGTGISKITHTYI